MRKNLAPARLISPSHFLRDLFVAHGYEAGHFHVIDNGLPDDFAICWPIAKQPPLTIGFVGTPVPVKGLHVLLAAVARLRNPVRVKVYADLGIDPVYAATLRKLAGANVEFNPPFDPGQAANAYGSFDLLAVPSLWWENAPMTIREARACCRPAVVSAIGGLKESVEPGRDGWHVPPGNVDALARLLHDLVVNPQLVWEMGQKLRPPARLSQTLPLVEEVYQRAIADAKPYQAAARAGQRKRAASRGR